MVKLNVFIPAAGRGTRLKQLTENTPKALVPFEGKPMIQHILEKTSVLKPAETIVNVHHHANDLSSFLKAYDRNIIISDETKQLLNTGGGLKKALSILKQRNNYPTLVYNVDIYTKFNLENLLPYTEMLLNEKTNTLAMLLVSERKSTRYLMFNKEMKLCAWKNINTGEQIIKKDTKEKLQSLAYSGIQLVNTKILNFMTLENVFPLIPEYLRLIETKDIIGIKIKDEIIDLGKLETLTSITNKNE